MRLILLTDIDDTLMQTARKCPSSQQLAVGAVGKQGSPVSYMTPQQRKLWSILTTQANVIIPVTARSAAGLARVALPFTQGAVVDFGATILDANGQPDPAWAQHLAQESQSLRQAAFFAQLQDQVGARHRLEKSVRAQSGGIEAYLQFRVEAGAAHADVLAHVREALAAVSATAYYLHVTDRDVTVLPRFVSKTAAVQWLSLSQGWDQDLVITMGDSLSDAGFMAHGDFFVVPSRSRIAQAVQGAARAQGEAA